MRSVLLFDLGLMAAFVHHSALGKSLVRLSHADVGLRDYVSAEVEKIDVC